MSTPYRFLVLLACCAACSKGGEPAPAGASPGAAAPPPSGAQQAATPDPATAMNPTPAADALDFSPGGPIPDAELATYQVEMSCAIDGEDAGTMVFEFWPEKAPVTVRNFLRYAAEGLYDRRTFHRIMRSFMIQGGCPKGDGTGSGKYGKISAEFSMEPKYHHYPGVISMARGQDPNSASCQFFICTDRQSCRSLDGQYASFGKLVSGMETLEKLRNVPTTAGARGEQSKPTQKVTMETVRVVRKTP